MKSDYGAWDHPNKSQFEEIKLTESQFLIPGFIDTHIHAPQVPNIGLGLDKPLLDWLNTYTFPLESQYKDEEFAKHVYEKVIVSIKRLLFYQQRFHWESNFSDELLIVEPQPHAISEPFTKALAKFLLMKLIKWVKELLLEKLQ